MNTFEKVLKMKQRDLFHSIKKSYKGFISYYVEDAFVLVTGEAPVMLVAHLDTVHKEAVQTICYSHNGNILMSPQGIGGDDRCGVFSLMEIYRQSQTKPWLLFTCDEETGGNGALAFCSSYYKGVLPDELDDLRMIIELDRKGHDDAVFYDCNNEDFEDYIISKGFKTNWGSFSDISYIAPDMGVAAVNLSCGYYNAHTLHEYINMEHMQDAISKVLEIIDEVVNYDVPRFEYVEAKFDYLDWTKYSEKYSSSSGTYLTDIPECIREEYAALLAYYTIDELEYFRAEMGNSSILLLYQSEFGGRGHEEI